MGLSFDYIYKNNDGIDYRDSESLEDTFYIKEGVESTNLETLLMTDFEQNTDVTVGQVLVFYSRLYGNNIKTYE